MSFFNRKPKKQRRNKKFSYTLAKDKCIARFIVQTKLYNDFKTKYPNMSEKFRSLMNEALTNSKGIQTIQRDNILGLAEAIDNSVALQISGNTGSGKTTLMKKVIKNDTEHIWIIIDSHHEYLDLKFPEINSINKDIKVSSIVKLPRASAGAVGLFEVYRNQILTEKLPDNFILVVEESHRYNVASLLKEARKFVKIILVTPEQLYTFCPGVEIIK